jgi:hypothetical protein
MRHRDKTSVLVIEIGPYANQLRPILHVFDVKEVRTLALASLGGALSPAHYIAPVTVLGIVATLMATTTQSSSPDI